MADEIIIETTSAEVIEVGVPGPQGPAGAAGTGLETLTTKGDTLYRGETTGERLPIGSTGQVLKVSAQGLPSWANESGAVTSVNGATGAVTVAAAQHAAEHEAGEADEIQAMAALVDTDVVALNGVYFWDGTLTSGRPNFFKTGTRKNTKIQWNNARSKWELYRNLTLEAEEASADSSAKPWDAVEWEDQRSPSVISSITVTRLGLEDMVQKLAETGGTATATTSEDGLMSSTDKTKLNGIAAGAEVNVQSNWTEADTASDAFILNKPSTFAPSAHAASHAAGGSDPLAPSDIGLGSADNVTFASVSAESLKDSSGAVIIDAESRVIYDGSGTNASDIVFGFGDGVLETALPISFSNDNNQASANAATTRTNLGVAIGTDVASASHTHAAADITSGTLAHERGGLEADVSAYSGLVKISGGATSAVTVTTAGEALLDDVDAAAQRTTLGLGAAATLSVGTTTGTVAAGDDSRITGAIQSTLVDAKGDLIVATAADTVARLPVGATNGHVLTVDSAVASGMKWAAASGGVSAMQSIAINFVLN